MKGVYSKAVGKSGKTWFYNKDGIYCWNHNDQKGFDGESFTFPITGGDVLVVKGPWCSNPKALLLDTGVNFFNQDGNEEE